MINSELLAEQPPHQAKQRDLHELFHGKAETQGSVF